MMMNADETQVRILKKYLVHLSTNSVTNWPYPGVDPCIKGLKGNITSPNLWNCLLSTNLMDLQRLVTKYYFMPIYFSIIDRFYAMINANSQSLFLINLQFMAILLVITNTVLGTLWIIASLKKSKDVSIRFTSNSSRR